MIAPLAFILAAALSMGERRVVFALQDVDFGQDASPGRVYLDTIAWAAPLGPPPDGLSEIEQDVRPESRAFARRYFDAKRTYRVWGDGGVPLGTARPDGIAYAGCSSLSAFAKTKAQAPAFVTNFDVAPREVHDREVTPEERRAVERYGRAYFAARGVRKIEVTDARIVDLGDGEPLLVASIAHDHTERSPVRAIAIAAPLSAVAPERLAPMIVVAAGEEDAGDPYFFGHLDFDGDGVDELVAVEYWIEAHQYLVYRRASNGRWLLAVRGGVTGC
ncbi:MAG TPA: hypothetical protein VF824_11495 [Thermoanaerobaculia bacterium]